MTQKSEQKSTAKPKNTTTKSKQGRPKGAKTVKKPESTGLLTRCNACGSTDRERYTNPRSIQQHGIAPDGSPYNQVTWRHTSCKSCGQVRVDKFYEMVPQKE